MTRCYPARRVAAQYQGGALAPATLSTQLRPRESAAVAWYIAPPDSEPRGPPLDARGWRHKKPRRAAAGIFPPKPKGRAGVAYPTTSVRRGAKDTATLRSPTAPHAQPVEGISTRNRLRTR